MSNKGDMKKLDWRLVERNLTDGSVVWDIVHVETGATIYCINERHPMEMYSAFKAHTIEVIE